MPSLNDVQEAIGRFRAALRDFDEALLTSHRDLHARHDVIDGAWRDDAARAYHDVFDPLDDVMTTYINTQAPAFEAFIDQKLAQLDHYLHGDI